MDFDGEASSEQGEALLFATIFQGFLIETESARSRKRWFLASTPESSPSLIDSDERGTG